MNSKQHIEEAERLLAEAESKPVAWPERTNLLLTAQVHLGLAGAKKQTPRRTTAKKETS